MGWQIHCTCSTVPFERSANYLVINLTLLNTHYMTWNRINRPVMLSSRAIRIRFHRNVQNHGKDCGSRMIGGPNTLSRLKIECLIEFVGKLDLDFEGGSKCVLCNTGVSNTITPPTHTHTHTHIHTRSELLPQLTTSRSNGLYNLAWVPMFWTGQ